MAQWWQGLPPVAGYLHCGYAIHELRWEAGQLLATDHDDPTAEATLAALAGEPIACCELLKAWQRRRVDPSVLLIGSRGPGDALAINLDEVDRGHGLSLPPAQKQVLRLLATGDPLGDRLQAEVAAVWTRRLRRGHSDLERVRPQLYAALYGRVLSALSHWRRDPELGLELTMVDEDGPRSISHASNGGLAVSLPFAWLSEVWARGLALGFGRFCLSAESVDGTHWTLAALDPDLSPAGLITIELGD